MVHCKGLSRINLVNTILGVHFDRSNLYVIAALCIYNALSDPSPIHSADGAYYTCSLGPVAIHSADSGTDGAYYTCSIGPIADTLCRRRLLYMLAWTHGRWTLRTLVRTALTIHARLDPLPINSADSGTDGAYYTKLAYVCILIVQYSVYIHIRDAPMYHRNIYIVYIVYCIQFKKNVIWCF